MTAPSRFTRIVALAWMVVAILALTEIARGVLALGVFSHAAPGFAGTCRTISLPGPGDLAADTADKLLFVAASDRRAAGAGDGLYVLDLADPKAGPQKLAGTPRHFHPYALALAREPDGSLSLAAVSRDAGGRSAIDIFKVSLAGGVKLALQTAIEGGLLTQPSAIALLPAGRFYAANATASRSAAMRWLETYALLPRANVLFFNGLTFAEAIAGLSRPEGLLVSADGTRLYVASANERRLLAFAITPFSGALKELGSLSLPARPGHMAADGHSLLVAARPKAAALTGYDTDASKPTPSQVYRVALDAAGVPVGYAQVYGDDGHGLGAASAVALAGKRLFIGSGLDSRLLDCRMN